MAHIVLVHGWGFDHHVWDRVRPLLPPTHEVSVTDFGFFGGASPKETSFSASPAPTFSQPVIAVGHSLGACWWLTQATMPWQRLLMINGFPRFTEADDYTPAVAPRVLARMHRNLVRQPGATLAEFRVACGAPLESRAAKDFDATQLANGLDWLAIWDGRARLAERADDIYALAGAHDPIVPAAMTRAICTTLGTDHLAWSEAPGHVLPLTSPDWCAEWIARVAAA